MEDMKIVSEKDALTLLPTNLRLAALQAESFPYEYPLALDCELEQIELLDGLVLSRMDDQTRTRLIGITGVKLNEQGRVESMMLKGEVQELLSPDINQNLTFYASNFLLTAANKQLANDFNFALKLIGISWSSLFIGRQQQCGSVAFCSPPCYFGKTRLRLDESLSQELRIILLKVGERTNDVRLGLMRDIWMYAMSEAPRRTSRFVEVSTLLEMLLLPKQSTELAFRFGLRVAKLGPKIGYDNPLDTFKMAKAIYSTRSKLVHSGSDSGLEGIEDSAYELARRLLAHFLKYPSEFDDDALDILCIRT